MAVSQVSQSRVMPVVRGCAPSLRQPSSAHHAATPSHQVWPSCVLRCGSDSMELVIWIPPWSVGQRRHF